MGLPVEHAQVERQEGQNHRDEADPNEHEVPLESPVAQECADTAEFHELLALLIGKGIVALNIIPDRNWNVADPPTRRLKVQNLHRVVELARELDLPLNVGTEMNSFGQKLVDGFDVPELAPLRQAFLDGACFVYGHTVLQRALGLGYQSDWAQSHLPTRRMRNELYVRVGRAMPPGKESMVRLRRLAPASSPAEILAELKN